jgi:RNA polymerase sigma factor (TIGR02999 family)
MTLGSESPADARPPRRGTDSLFESLYSELRSMAGHQIRREWRKGHTFQSIDLVNEAYLRLNNAQAGMWQDRTAFKAAAAVVMRRVLCDHARKRKALKRGEARAHRTLLDDLVSGSPSATIDPLVFDELLTRLAEKDERATKVVEMKVFSGMTMAEIASVLEISKRTAESDWAYARTWLYCQLRDGTSSG